MLLSIIDKCSRTAAFYISKRNSKTSGNRDEPQSFEPVGNEINLGTFDGADNALKYSVYRTG